MSLLAAVAFSLVTAEAGSILVSPSRVSLSPSAGECWSVAFIGPEFFEQALRQGAAERSEELTPDALEAARREVVSIGVWPGEATDCGDEAPEALWVMDGRYATLSSIPLALNTDVKTDSAGVTKAFRSGHGEISFAAAQALFDGSIRMVYLLTTRGRRGGWRLRNELSAVHSIAAWQARREEQLAEVRERFERACHPDMIGVGKELEVIATWLASQGWPPDRADVGAIGQGYVTCLERLRGHGSKDVRNAASRILGAMTKGPTK
jgi:hypothetical protein